MADIEKKSESKKNISECGYCEGHTPEHSMILGQINSSDFSFFEILNSSLKENVSERGYREGHTPEQELLTKYLLSRLLNNGEDSSETGEDLLFKQMHCLY